MKILVIGSGGREHALVWAMRQTAQPLEVFCAPGNAGISQLAQSVPTSVGALQELAAFADAQKVDLTFVGPEAPLAAGVVDLFEQRSLPIVGPTAAAARLEGSKVFAKDFMARHGIPTAHYKVADSPASALSFLRSGEFGPRESSVVIKADGLAAGKGVIVGRSHTEGEQAIEALMVNHDVGAEAAERIVIEEALEGREVSLLLFADGRDYALMPAARDHKRIGENDTGPNTGGMGSITDPSILAPDLQEKIVTEIVEPSLEGARQDGFPFKGILFLGLMLTAAGPRLLEYNVRFGDPETQAILVRLKTDLIEVLDSMRTGTLGNLQLDWAAGSSGCVVLANPGYPGKHQSGAVIEGLENLPDDAVQVFHAGTSLSPEGKFLATGGRVLGVTCAGQSLSDSLARCYQAIERIHWPGMQFRRDIGRSAGS